MPSGFAFPAFMHLLLWTGCVSLYVLQDQFKSFELSEGLEHLHKSKFDLLPSRCLNDYDPANMDVLQAIDTSAPSRETDIDAILAEVDAQVRKTSS